MKKLILIAATWLTLAGCTKEATAPASEEITTNNSINSEAGETAKDVRATIKWTSDPAVDGFGWVLRISQERLEIPKNLPDSYKKDGVEVLVSYRKTSERFPCRCAEPKFYVEITEISPLNP